MKRRLIKLIYSLSEIENNIKWSTQKTIMFQTGIIKLCSNIENQGIEELENRVQKIEKQIQDGQFISKNNVIAQKPKNVVVNNVQNKTSRPTANNKINTSNLKSQSYWPEIVNNFKKDGKIMLYTNLMNTNAKEINDMTVGIEFPNGITSFGKTVLEKAENINEIKKQVSIACGKEMQIRYIDLSNPNKVNDNIGGIEDLVKGLDIPINIIEE